jgi:hypothetical protein
VSDPQKLDYASPNLNRPADLRKKKKLGLIGFLIYGIISLVLTVLVIAILSCPWPMVILVFPMVLFIPAALFCGWRAFVSLRQFRSVKK